MTTYNGPATIVAGDVEIEVEATLATSFDGALTSWAGSVEAEGGEDFYEVMRSDDVKIRMPDGSEGAIVPTHTSVGTGQLEVQGSGKAPF